MTGYETIAAKSEKIQDHPSLDAARLAGGGRPRVLCVDDEPNVLEGLRLHLERPYRLSTAASGFEALDMLERDGPYAIVVSDMRMPKMDGAAFLGQVRQRFPDTVRLLLTGHTDLDAAISCRQRRSDFPFSHQAMSARPGTGSPARGERPIPSGHGGANSTRNDAARMCESVKRCSRSYASVGVWPFHPDAPVRGRSGRSNSV